MLQLTIVLDMTSNTPFHPNRHYQHHYHNNESKRNIIHTETYIRIAYIIPIGEVNTQRTYLLHVCRTHHPVTFDLPVCSCIPIFQCSIPASRYDLIEFGSEVKYLFDGCIMLPNAHRLIRLDIPCSYLGIATTHVHCSWLRR